ncbi:hypothetical protein OG302_29410 [Streptomyces sp. NBC_01283]|uniref:hypothetical protein n=1 Tax=Streptomyces sp. NBC_01283 TaxID=2903812 RepID=UPI00352E598B|nr:hypothetical protein OG302_29410 [Streptomyces sp. NBC_01283]
MQAQTVGTPAHRLVAIGDSFMQNFQSGAVFNEHLSVPALIARQLGILHEFNHPKYGGPGGIPLNLEFFSRALGEQFGNRITWLDIPSAYISLFRFVKQIRAHSYSILKGAGEQAPNIYHNLSMYGFEIPDFMHITADVARERIGSYPTPSRVLVPTLPSHQTYISALQILGAARKGEHALTAMQCAQSLGDDGTREGVPGDGIETLLVWMGWDCAIRPATDLLLRWSKEPFSTDPYHTMLRPEHFAAQLEKLTDEMSHIKTRQVLWATIPSLTVLPILQGVGPRPSGTRYYPQYARPWAFERRFEPMRHPHITGTDVRQVDEAIDSYNEAITKTVRDARLNGRDWRLVDIAALFDDLSCRTLQSPETLAEILPPAITRLTPIPDTRFFVSDTMERVKGGLFSLDGVHPTTIGYGLVAREFLEVMHTRSASQGESGDSVLDFERIAQEDTLVSNPPPLTRHFLHFMARLDRSRVMSDSLAIARRKIGHLSRLGRLTAPAALSYILISFIMNHLHFTMQGLVLIISGLILARQLEQVSNGGNRERLFDRLVARWGTAAPIMYAVNVVACAIVFFASLTFILHSTGIAEVQSERNQSVQASSIGAFYLWELADAIPLADVDMILKWKQPLGYTSQIVGVEVLLFRLLIIVPLIVAISEGWKNSTERNERYRRHEADQVARDLGMD